MRTRTPVVVTGFPALAKDITPGPGLLTDFNGAPRAQTVYVGASGDVEVQPVGNPEGQTVIFTCPTGGLVPVEVTRVLAGNTTATGLIGLF